MSRSVVATLGQSHGRRLDPKRRGVDLVLTRGATSLCPGRGPPGWCSSSSRHAVTLRARVPHPHNHLRGLPAAGRRSHSQHQKRKNDRNGLQPTYSRDALIIPCHQPTSAGTDRHDRRYCHFHRLATSQRSIGCRPTAEVHGGGSSRAYRPRCCTRARRGCPVRCDPLPGRSR